MTNTDKHYDYIIAGGGCAGLSLVYYLLQTKLKDKRILIIDKDHKKDNDRTWCFWEKEPHAFEHLVFHRWCHMYFHSSTFTERLDLAPYAYKMIRGIDFYEHITQFAGNFPNVEFLQGTIESIAEDSRGTKVKAEGNVYEGKWVFNSTRKKNEQAGADSHHYLLQHFKGWVIKTEKAFFDPEEAVLMDFRIAQHGDCRFVYVLPTDEHTALVEYTIFSEALIPQDAYDQAIRAYLNKFLKLESYSISHEEFGVIPMTDMPYTSQVSDHIINIGTAGGITKPSTGYTFLRIQQDTQEMVSNLLANGSPCRQRSTWDKRFHLYDGALLHVLADHLQPADQVFTDLFKNNPTSRVFKFLDEQTSLWEEIQVANSVSRLAFSKGIIYALLR